MKKTNGFTLIELMGIIIILAIVSVIVVPISLNIVETTNKESYKRSVESLFKSAKIYISKNPNNSLEKGINVKDLEVSKNKFINGIIYEDSDGLLHAKGITNGKFCANGTKEHMNIEKGNCDDIEQLSVSVVKNKVLSSSISVTAKTSSPSNKIRGYQFIIAGEKTPEQDSSTYIFHKLKKKTKYSVQVKVIGTNNAEIESNIKEIETLDVIVPTIDVSPRTPTNKHVTAIMMYDKRQTNYLYEYSIDSGKTWELVDKKHISISLKIKENTTLLARVRDIDNSDNDIIGDVITIANIDKEAPKLFIPMDVEIDTTIADFDLMDKVSCTDNSNSCTISIIGEIEYGVQGVYIITYKAVDLAHNEIFQNRTIVVGPYKDKSGANRPILLDNMIPIKYDGENWIKADISKEWYDYDKKQWANVVIVDDYTKYQNLAVDSKIDENDVIAYFVWIPRFSYKPFSSEKEEIIDIKFIPTNNIIDVKIPEAFTLRKQTQNINLPGFWVYKFEVSLEDNIIKSLPNKDALRTTTLKNYQELINNTTYYGTDKSLLHIIKNSEWGAIAYLANSKYGYCTATKCSLPNRNPTFTTGMYNSTNSYDSELGKTTSLTKNIYGIYDMVGCSQEKTLGTNSLSAIFLQNLSKEYYDDYLNNEYFNGDATVETKNWYGNTIPTIGDTYTTRLYARGGNRYENFTVFYTKLDSGSGGINNSTRFTLYPIL